VFQAWNRSSKSCSTDSGHFINSDLLYSGFVNPDLFVHWLSRFVHIGSVVLFLGGIAYARQVLLPTLNALPDDFRRQTAASTHTRWRATLYVLLALIVLSGLYNFFEGPKHGRTYQIWFGIKILFVAHILASAILWAVSAYGDTEFGSKRKHRLLSITISGLIVVGISAYLRSLTLRGL